MRKSLLQFAYMGAIALVGSVGFSACSDDQKELEKVINPGGQKVDYQDVVNVNDVPVDFLFNVSTNTGADTRMMADAVQQNGVFRGINKARIIAYKTANNGDWVTNPAAPATAGAPGMLRLFPEFASLMSGGASAASTRVLELSMPSGTNAILFYGTAPNGGNYDKYGKIAHNDNGGKVEHMILSYQQRLTGDAKTYFYRVGNVIAAVMTGLADMGFKSDSPQNNDKDFYFWWPEGNADETKNNDNTLADQQSISYSDEIYRQIYGSPKRTNRTANGGDGDPEIAYLAKHITTGNYDNGKPGNTAIVNDKVDGLTVTKTVDGVKYALYHSDVTWKAYGMWDKGTNTTNTTDYPDYGGAYETDLSGLGQKLGAAYNALTTKDDAELRSAASSDFLALAKDLYDVIQKVQTANPTTKKEYVATKFAARLISRMQNYIDFTGSTPAWKDISQWGDDLVNYVKALSNNLNVLNITGLTKASFDNFPTGSPYNMPPGATLLDFSYMYGTNNMGNYKNKGGLFSFIVNIPNYDLGGGATGNSYVTAENYVYPAELLYFGNSPVRVSNSELVVGNYPTKPDNTEGGWLNAGSWTSNGWTDEPVSSSTRSVAMKNNINYGVAMLATRVRIQGEGGIIKDNNAAIAAVNHNTETDKEISVTDGMFELTGIIIGQQPQSVGWDYTPATVTSSAGVDGAKDMKATNVDINASDKSLKYWDRLVYDKVYNSGGTEGVSVTTAPAPDPASYTLLLDNYMDGDVQTVYKNFVNSSSTVLSANQQQIVYVALEFKNKAGNFMGMHNMVRNGSKFYLIGALNPESLGSGGTAAVTRTDGYALPPYSSGNAIDWKPRVFMQDYMTQVTFTIGVNSLKKAYLTVPNLKASQVSLGLSVDINWEQGINFGDVTLGQ